MKPATATIRDYLFDIGKIVEGALSSDREKVAAYTEQLRRRLEDDGQADAAKRFDALLRNGKTASVGPARSALEASRPPVDNESRLPVADMDVFPRGSIQVYLPDQAQSLVTQFVGFVRAADRLAARGMSVAPSMLIYGPPGCGKTLLARHIASELSLPLLTARADALISSYLGSTSKNVRALFEHAMSRPCVLFLDEFDALGKMRDDSAELGELKRVVISLLQNIDAMRGDHVLLAATNHEHLLDPAIWRRFSYRIRLDKPDLEARQRIFVRALREFGGEEMGFMLAAISDGLSGADCEQVAEEAVRVALVEDSPSVNLQAMLRAILTRREGGDSLLRKPIREQVRGVRRILGESATQQHIGLLLGISQPQVSKLLKGGRARAKR